MKQSNRTVRYSVVLGIESVLAVILFMTRGGPEAADRKALFSILCDAAFVPGIITCCFGLLIVVSNGGVFDMVRYAFAKAADSFRKTENKRGFPGSYYDYVCARHGGKQAQFGFILISGLVFILFSIVFCSLAL